MSHGETAEDINTPMGELANLMNDTFSSCLRNYEALLPYFEKKETEFKIYHRLVQINVLLNKLNEELVGLRVEYVTVSSCLHKRETLLTQDGRKRKKANVAKLNRHMTKSEKTEVSFSNNTECSVALSLENGINKQEENLISMDTKKTRKSNMLKLDIQCAQNIKMETQDSDEPEYVLAHPTDSSEILAAQTTYDTGNASAKVHFAGGEGSTYVAIGTVVGSISDKPMDTFTEKECNEEYVPLQNITKLANQVNSAITSSCQADKPLNGRKSPITVTTCSKETAPLLKKSSSSCNQEEKNATHFHLKYGKDEQYDGIIYEKGKFKCTLCKHRISQQRFVLDHVNSQKHQQKRLRHVQSNHSLEMELCERD